MKYENENDPFEEMEREIKLIVVIISTISCAIIILLFWFTMSIFTACGSTKQKEICPAYKVYERKH